MLNILLGQWQTVKLQVDVV